MPFTVETDALSVAVGAVLSRRDENGRVYSINFASRTMTRAKGAYSACEREALAVFFALKTFCSYLTSHRNFAVLSFSEALKTSFRRIIFTVVLRGGQTLRWKRICLSSSFQARKRGQRASLPARLKKRIIENLYQMMTLGGMQ